MSYERKPLGPTEFGIPIGCAVCGFTYHYPHDIRLHSDGKYRCTVFCDDPTNDTEDARRRAQQKPIKNENTIRLKGAVNPGYFD